MLELPRSMENTASVEKVTISSSVEFSAAIKAVRIFVVLAGYNFSWIFLL
jgi:hypothetical protein